MKINRKNNFGFSLAGFTLVEMLVAISIFALVATLASSMFSTFANNQKRTKASQELLNNSQYVLEMVSREIKNNEIITFDDDPTGRCQSIDPQYTQCLLFVRESGETAGFIYDQANGILAYTQLECQLYNGIYSDCTLSGQPTTLLSTTANKTQISALNFVLQPTTNPYFSETVNRQPLVTIQMVVKYPSTQAFEQITHYLQTTVSSRIYKR